MRIVKVWDIRALFAEILLLCSVRYQGFIRTRTELYWTNWTVGMDRKNQNVEVRIYLCSCFKKFLKTSPGMNKNNQTLLLV